jgi:hypothetical protein
MWDRRMRLLGKGAGKQALVIDLEKRKVFRQTYQPSAGPMSRPDQLGRRQDILVQIVARTMLDTGHVKGLVHGSKYWIKR